MEEQVTTKIPNWSDKFSLIFGMPGAKNMFTRCKKPKMWPVSVFKCHFEFDEYNVEQEHEAEPIKFSLLCLFVLALWNHLVVLFRFFQDQFIHLICVKKRPMLVLLFM